MQRNYNNTFILSLKKLYASRRDSIIERADASTVSSSEIGQLIITKLTNESRSAPKLLKKVAIKVFQFP